MSGAARTRTALFIVTSFWAFGELAIAVEFARRLPAAGWRPLFLVPPTHREKLRAAGLDHQVLTPGAGKVNRVVLADLEHVDRPAVVVLADFMNYDFCDRHYGLTRDDLAVFDCPVGTFDNFSWGRPGSPMDTYGFRAANEQHISVDGLAFRLRPCPLNNPLAASAPGVYHYPLLADPTELRPAPEPAVRAEFGLPRDRPVVLLTGASWQRMHGAYPTVTGFVEVWQAMVERVLTRVLAHADVVAVGPPPAFEHGGPPGWHALGQLAPAEFERLARTATAHVSNNVISVSLHRLALGGVPSVLLHSSLRKRRGELRSVAGTGPRLDEHARALLSDVDELYPCRMFPVGWYRFLDSLLADNPFTAVVPELEVFDEESCVDALASLVDGETGTEAARLGYLAALDRLPDVPAIMDELVETATDLAEAR